MSLGLLFFFSDKTSVFTDIYMLHQQKSPSPQLSYCVNERAVISLDGKIEETRLLTKRGHDVIHVQMVDAVTMSLLNRANVGV